MKKKKYDKSKYDIVLYWAKQGEIIDIGEPACMACGEFWQGRYDNGTPEENWNNAPLEKCHIIPKSLGGTDTPDNLFLMCHDCHGLAPNTSDRNVFLLWASSQDWLQRFANQAVDAFSSYGLDVDDDLVRNEFEDFIHGIDDGIREKCSIHFDTQKGAVLTASTIVGLYVTHSKAQATSI